MTRLLLIRHGQSVANVEKFFAGHLDSPLTELGMRQAELTAGYIASKYLVDRVYASDLSRAYMTGKAVADLYGLPTVACEQLRELNAGLWEGVPYESLVERFPETYQIWLSDIGNAVSDAGESVRQLQDRVVSAILDICKQNQGKTVVVATHATPIRALQCYCEGRALDEMKDVPWVSNASVSEFHYESNRLLIDQISYDAHLGVLKSVLPDKC